MGSVGGCYERVETIPSFYTFYFFSHYIFLFSNWMRFITEMGEGVSALYQNNHAQEKLTKKDHVRELEKFCADII